MLWCAARPEKVFEEKTWSLQIVSLFETGSRDERGVDETLTYIYVLYVVKLETENKEYLSS